MGGVCIVACSSIIVVRAWAIGMQSLQRELVFVSSWSNGGYGIDIYRWSDGFR
jgi:hypothetical protein